MIKVRERDEIRVLMICTANMCRSPIAEAVLRDAIARAAIPWTVSSAGVIAQDGRPMDAKAAKVLAERAIAMPGWTARRLVPGLIEQADLVLTAELQHRSTVVRMVPAAISRTFALLQFARFADHAGPAGPRSAEPRSAESRSAESRSAESRSAESRSAASSIERIIAAREDLQPVPAGSDDLADPIGRSIRHFRDCADTVARAVEQIVGAVTERSASRRR